MHEPMSPGHAYTNHGGQSTSYSIPNAATEDSIYQISEASISAQRNRFNPGKLPKIGSANPEIQGRFKRGKSKGVTPTGNDLMARQL